MHSSSDRKTSCTHYQWRHQARTKSREFLSAPASSRSRAQSERLLEQANTSAVCPSCDGCKTNTCEAAANNAQNLWPPCRHRRPAIGARTPCDHSEQHKSVRSIRSAQFNRRNRIRVSATHTKTVHNDYRATESYSASGLNVSSSTQQQPRAIRMPESCSTNESRVPVLRERTPTSKHTRARARIQKS
jgi:hypothetical protein